MSFTSLFSTSFFQSALTDLQRKFAEARASLLHVRGDRLRLARTGWRPRVPSETKLIRAAEWRAEFADQTTPDFVNFDLESRFVPTERAFDELGASLDRVREEEKTARVFIRGLELDEPRCSIAGRPVCAAFFDLVLTFAHHPGAVIVLPKVDGYLEARFWAEVGRALEASLGFPRNAIRFEALLETLGGLVEAEEILFELKDSIVGVVYDVRLDRIDDLRMESGAPRLPREDTSDEPWTGAEIFSRAEALQTLALKRGVRLERRPASSPSETGPKLFTLDSLHEKALFALRFLREWFDGNPLPEGKDWVDFELARALLWTAIHSGFLREENYEAWCAELGTRPFEAGSASDAAIRTLDPLVRTAIFPDSAKPLAFSILLEREKTRSVSSLRLA